jgi:HEAT repeat protein
MSELPAVRFLRTLCGAILREEEPGAAAARAHEALQELWASERSLVLEVQFTGFMSRGQRVGGVEPAYLRAAGQLIVHRISRVGFTPEVRAEDLQALLAVVVRPPAELGGEGAVGAVRAAAPRGIYVSTSTGEVYKPAAPPVAEPPAAEAVEAPAAEPDAPAAPSWSSGVGVDLTAAEQAELSSFEFVDEDAEPSAAPAARPAAAPEPERSDEPAAHDMFHFFKTSDAGRGEEDDAEALVAQLHGTDNTSRFDDLAVTAARGALRHVRSGHPLQALLLLEALVKESERGDRTRLFRDSAAQALRTAGSSENLPHAMDLLQITGPDRERVLQVLSALGKEAVALLEGHLLRTGDAELRRAIFRVLRRGEDGGRGFFTRALAESPAKARTALELVADPELDRDQAARWVTEAAAHRDPTVRADAARAAVGVGGRGGLRALVDLLADEDRAVRRAALHGLASMEEPAAVPFLTRFLNENSDDDLQLAAVAALGRTHASDAIPVLLAIVNKRQLFGGKKAKSLKVAAIEAIGMTGAPAARDVLTSISGGSDSELAAEARRALAQLG